MSDTPQEEKAESPVAQEQTDLSPIVEVEKSTTGESKELTCDALNALGSVSTDVVTGVSAVGADTLFGVSAALNAIYQPLTNMFSWNSTSGSLPLRKLGNQGLVVPPQGVSPCLVYVITFV